ncbi:response regulator transcription factor [Sphingomonas sp. HHU CXW]|uniref:Response regulator transcription factor n=1 Tax=Sphingomonas hominis TaxID=2741495 RepID=A0ABX2JKA5_9SPHN|nr:response regulator [Sphingomonas hominis]NTS65171.1 response regulator transcription factor [Sphingomonas hominis]
MFVYLVDDDKDLAKTIIMTLEGAGHRATHFSSGEAFLNVSGDLPSGCVLLDLMLPAMSGLELQAELVRRDHCHAVALLTGYGDVCDAVTAMRAGAIDFLRKPYKRAELLDVLARAATHIDECERRRSEATKYEPLKRLSLREQEVLDLLGKGLSSKQAAGELAISTRTIDMHRANILRKLGVISITAALLLARDASTAGSSGRR